MKSVPLYEAIAVGGPRDGVKLTAQANWDGRVRYPAAANSGAQGSRYEYPGNYVYRIRQSDNRPVWLWIQKADAQPARQGPRGAVVG